MKCTNRGCTGVVGKYIRIEYLSDIIGRERAKEIVNMWFIEKLDFESGLCVAP